MNFMEALKEKNENYKQVYCVLYPKHILEYSFVRGYILTNDDEELLMCYKYYNADWEVAEDDKDWNLADQKDSDEDIYFTDVKKCRDLIIKELDEDLANDSGVQQSQRRIWHNWFKKVVNERFGDL